MIKAKLFDKDLYKKTSTNDLILFCIFSISGKKEKCSFEKLIQECFSSFPEVFSFPGIKKWPDSRKLDRPLRALRKKKMIAGNLQGFFSLTKEGKKSAQETFRVLGQRRLQI
jgi:hypothetical protein